MEKLNVFIRFLNEEKLLGQLVVDDANILFKYSEQYLNTGSNISPFKLVFNNDIQRGPVVPFKGLHGVFSDALPDAWGQLLMRKHLNKKGIALETLNMLEYLSYVGENGLGSLIYRPSNNSNDIDYTSVNLDHINTNVNEVLKGEGSEIIDQLFAKDGSPGGARPKIYVRYNEVKDTLVYGGTHYLDGYDDWIIKFASTVDANEIANIEMAYHYMALDAGLEMSQCKLFIGQSGKTYFGTKRFDRIGNSRLHMISAAGLLHDDYERSQLDYGTLLQAGGELGGNADIYEQILRQAAFNVFAHNRDDHSKNFAFLMNASGQWKFAPSYDLTFSSSSQGQHSTTCAGNGTNPGTKELLELAEHFSIKKAKAIIEKVKDTVSNWNDYAEKAEVSKNMREPINKVIRSIIS